ncbi:Ivy family c-type lysozyme inhibitor [Ancylobacter sp. VNQ12]|uniref:Ivy family c-type lysozyme inhibitor n=1 Tax=Ancylobacter sp. VNQ12 TaxID=3400920 RepID=UPI003C0CD2F6
MVGPRHGLSMRAAPGVLLALVLVGLSAPALANTEGKTALYEVIFHEPYRGAWKRLTAPVVAANRWLKGARGIWHPARMVTVDAQHFKVFFLCKVNECAANRITVIFGPGGHHAYGAFRSPAGTQILGAPNDDTRRALLKVLIEEPPRE